jgi:hypothetical protein
MTAFHIGQACQLFPPTSLHNLTSIFSKNNNLFDIFSDLIVLCLFAFF